jgi:hypothetical protein
MIFVLAAAVAIMLYQQMPRVAFESERDKEQLLIDRGEQYKRAIALYYTENRRFPATLDDLEKTNNHRYLRRRYLDPYTGKDEWRLIHTNGSFLTDSLVQKPPANPANTTGNQPLTANNAGLQPAAPGLSQQQTAPSNPNNPSAPQPVNAAVLTRPSDRPFTQNSGAFAGTFTPPQQPVQSGYVDPASYPPITLFPNGYNPPAQQPGQPTGQPGFQPGFQPGGVPQPGVQPGFPQAPQAGQLPGQFPQAPVQPGQFQQPQFQPGQFQPGQFQPGQFQPGQFQPGQQPVAGFPQQNVVNQFPNPTDPNNNLNAPAQQFPVQNQPFPNQNINPSLPGGIVPLPGLNTNFPNQFPQQNPNPVVPNSPPFDPNNPNNTANQFPQQQSQPLPIQQQPFPVQPQQFPGQQPQNTQALNGPPQGSTVPSTNAGINAINQLLTTPRQPPPGIGPTAATNQTVGGGIAGVASTFKGPTIKTYGDRMKFEEWEFIWQLPQQQGIPGAGANPLQNGQNGNNPAAAQPGQGGIGPGGITPGGINPGGINPGGINPGGMNPGGANPGMPFPQQPQQPNGLPPLP